MRWYMSLTVVLSAWVVMLGTLGILKSRQHGVVTSVSKFHRQLIVLGRTSSSYGILSRFERTESIFVSQSTLRSTDFPTHMIRETTGSRTKSSNNQRYSHVDLRQRRSTILFSLLVMFLVACLVVVLSPSIFSVTMTLALLTFLILYIFALVRIRINKQSRTESQRNSHSPSNQIGLHYASKARPGIGSSRDSGFRAEANRPRSTVGRSN